MLSLSTFALLHYVQISVWISFRIPNSFLFLFLEFKFLFAAYKEYIRIFLLYALSQPVTFSGKNYFMERRATTDVSIYCDRRIMTGFFTSRNAF